MMRLFHVTKETRKDTLLLEKGRIYDGIIAGTSFITDIKTRAQKLIDTTNLSPRKLRDEISCKLSPTGTEGSSRFQVMSFWI